MRFYRLEKQNLWSYWAMAMLKSFGIALAGIVLIGMILGNKFMIVSSGSMSPTLPVGSLIIVTPCKYEDLQLGDIVTMNKGGYHLTHRIAGKRALGDNSILANPGEEGYDAEEYAKGIWYTRGDYPGSPPDAKLDNNEIVGKVYENHCFPITGDIVMYVKANYILLIVFLLILSIFMYILRILKEKLETEDVECYDNDEE